MIKNRKLFDTGTNNVSDNASDQMNKEIVIKISNLEPHMLANTNKTMAAMGIEIIKICHKLKASTLSISKTL